MKHLKRFEGFFGGTHLGNDQVNNTSATVRDINFPPDEYNDDPKEEEKNTTIWTDKVVNWCKNNNVDYKVLSRSGISNILSKMGCSPGIVLDMISNKTWNEIKDID